MRQIARHLVALSALAIVAACGSASGDDGSANAGSGQETGGSSHQVVSISVHQAGGLKPVDQTRVFSADAKPPAGFTEQDVEAALRAADVLAASGLSTPRKLPTGMCSDCFTFDITLTLADGSTQRYSVAGGIRQPPAISDLLATVS